MRNAKNPFSSSGCAGRNSRYQASTSAAWSSGHRIGPATTVETGCRFNVSDVTTPKLPPPPRIAHSRSAFSSSLARAKLPSARTTSAATMLSIDRPYFRVRWPTPPPSRRPTPVVQMIADRRREPESVRRMIDVGHHAAAADLRGARARIDARPAHRREVDHETVVHRSETRAVVSSRRGRRCRARSRGRTRAPPARRPRPGS